jgi:hypothetical protein
LTERLVSRGSDGRKEKTMKLSFIGLCVAGTALAIILQTGGAAGPISSAFAAEEGCIVTQVAYHVRRCPPGVAFAGGGNSSYVAEPTATVEPTVTPTAAPPEGCIKTDVMLHVRRCPAGV